MEQIADLVKNTCFKFAPFPFELPFLFLALGRDRRHPRRTTFARATILKTTFNLRSLFSRLRPGLA